MSSASPAAGSVVISIDGDAIVVRGTQAVSYVGFQGAAGGELSFIAGPPEAEPLEAGPGCRAQLWPPIAGLYPGAPPPSPDPRKTQITCPSAGVARLDVNLGDGANTLEPSLTVAQPLPVPLRYVGGSGVDQVGPAPGTIGSPVAVSAGTLVEGGGGDDRLTGAGGRYVGGSGNDTISIHDLAREGAAGLTVADGGEGNDRLSGSSPDPVPTPDDPEGDFAPEGHVIGGPGNDVAGGRLVQGGDGNDRVGGIFVDAGPGDDTVSGGAYTESLDCGPGIERWGRGRPNYRLRPAVVHADCPPVLLTERELGAMHYDRHNRLLVPLRFTEPVEFSGRLVSYRGCCHAFVHRLRGRVPARGRVFRLTLKPEALKAMLRRGRRAYVAIDFTARDSQGEPNVVRRGDAAIEGWARRRRRSESSRLPITEVD